MFKTKKQIIVTASVLLGIVVALLVYFGLIMTGAINLLQRNLIFTSGSHEQTYSVNSSVICHTHEFKSGNLYTGHYYEVDYLSELKSIGSIDNEFVVTIYDSNGNVVTSKYDVTLRPGTLTMSGVPIKIKTGDDSKIYDGTELIRNEYNILSGELLEGHAMEVDVTGSITNFGVTDNTCVVVIFDANQIDVTNLYKIDKELGTLEITKKTISVRSGSAEKIYDGEPLTTSAYSELTSPLDGHKLTVDNLGTITTPGSVENDITWVVKDADGNDISENYSVLLHPGTLTIVQRDYIVKTFDDSKEYDGEELKNEKYEITGLVSTHYHAIKTSASITNVGEEVNVILLKISDVNGNDVTEYYNLIPMYGELSVIHFDIKVTTESDEKSYDGQIFVNSNYELSRNLVDGHRLVDIDSTKIRYPQRVENELSFKIHDSDGNDVTSNYNVEDNFGYLTIFAKDIVISTMDFTYNYTGAEYVMNNVLNNVVDISVSGIDFIFTGVIKDVGQIKNDGFVVYDSEVLEYCYNIIFDFGIVTMLKQSIYVQTLSEDFMYDDIFYSHAYATINSTTLGNFTIFESFNNEIIEVNGFRSFKALGTYYNTVEIELKDMINYEVVLILGGVTIWDEGKIFVSITPKDITVGVSSSTIYANDCLTSGSNLKGLDVFLEKGFYYSASISGEINSIGYTNTTIESFVLFDQKGEVVAWLNEITQQVESDMYRVQLNEGLMVMTDVTIIATSEYQEKVYDGLPLIVDENISIIGTLPSYIQVYVEGTITNVGTIKPVVKVKNIFTNEDLTKYYNIDNRMENLTITHASVTFNCGAIYASEYQDLSEINVNATVTSVTNIFDYEIILRGFAGEIYSSTSLSSNNSNIYIYDKDGNDITENFTIKLEGTIIVL